MVEGGQGNMKYPEWNVAPPTVPRGEEVFECLAGKGEQIYYTKNIRTDNTEPCTTLYANRVPW